MRSLVLAAVVVAASCHPSPDLASRTTTTFVVGLRELTGVDPVSKGPLPMAMFYPATGGSAATRTQIMEYPIEATRDLGVAAGTFPLIAISHGHGGTMWGHHDLATALAKHGYIVAVVEHVGDDYRDSSHSRSDRMALGRAHQITATIDAVLADPVVGPHVDQARIGVAGFSMGGWTSLLVIGARPDFSRMTSYCETHRDDAEVCGGPVELTETAPTPTVDRRVKAAFVMAPFAVALAADAFRDVTAPIFLAWATHDHVLRPEANAAIVEAAPTLAGKHPIDADHYVFLTPCGPQLDRHLPEICIDAPGVDRAKIHTKLDTEAVRFFDEHLRANSGHL
jgi:predicted dienelactone hydrolase